MQEEFDSGKLLSFSTVAAKLLSLVSAPLLEALSGQPMVSVHVFFFHVPLHVCACVCDCLFLQPGPDSRTLLYCGDKHNPWPHEPRMYSSRNLMKALLRLIHLNACSNALVQCSLMCVLHVY